MSINQDFLVQKNLLLRTYRKTLKRVQKSYDNALLDLEKCHAWQMVHHTGELLQANLYKIKKGVNSVTVHDWLHDDKNVKIPLNSQKEPHEQVAALFRQARKLKAGVPHMERQVERMRNELERVQKIVVGLQLVDEESKLEPFKIPSKPKQVDQDPIIKRYREYITESGLSIWVGKSAKDNDILTFRLANGSDWWFHISDFPGSHVVLRLPKNTEPDQESIKDSLLVALHHSKAKDRGEAEVCVTQCKYVTRAGKNKPGQVQISKHKNIKIVNDAIRFQQLRQRQHFPPKKNL